MSDSYICTLETFNSLLSNSIQGYRVGLVVSARRKHAIPSRTRPLRSSAPMILGLKSRESRSLPSLLYTLFLFLPHHLLLSSHLIYNPSLLSSLSYGSCMEISQNPPFLSLLSRIELTHLSKFYSKSTFISFYQYFSLHII